MPFLNPLRARSSKVLIVLHQENSTPGRVGQSLRRRGFNLDIRRPRFGDPLTTTMADHAGAVAFGGPMSANDSDAFVRREINWFDVPLREAAPCLGICLGAQMLARNLGADVRAHSDGYAEIGYYPLTATDEGKAFMKWPEKVYQWHREGFDLPTGAQLLTSGNPYHNQAFRVGPSAFGIQFHPEPTLAMMYRWTTHAAPRMQLPGAQGRRDHFAGRAIFDQAIQT
ncbi:glutamine amidotransferase [Breoghania sp.]|uniref:glutamine amidotransferase n=1 Tax=Breoghania sp. TaxID=2065378 RepID=UPI002637B720|nr:glutamine amidotransferase [Breoghania sp.]MDJ0932634.1 glutamine amidotransferase [Breoghania sp.]